MCLHYVCLFASVSQKHMSKLTKCLFLPRDAMLTRYMLSSCVCLSVCLSQAGIVLKVRNDWTDRIDLVFGMELMEASFYPS